jgi:hypothetical protein
VILLALLESRESYTETSNKCQMTKDAGHLASVSQERVRSDSIQAAASAIDLRSQKPI